MNKKFCIRIMLVFSFFLLFFQTFTAKAEQKDLTVSAKAGAAAADIQKLLDFNKDGSYNLTIEIPAGSYELKRELLIYSNTTIIADPNAKIYKNHHKGAMITNDLSKDKGGYDTSVNITIIGGIWDSSKIADKKKGTESFRFIHADGVTIENATVCNVPENSHLITFAGVKDGLIKDCTLYGYAGSKPKEAIQLDIVHDRTRVPSMQAPSIRYDDLPCNGIKITGCEIYNFPRAIGSHTSIKGVFHKNIEITKNNLHDLREAAIKLYNYQNTLVSENTIHNTAVGVLTYTYISNGKNHYLEALKRTKKEPLPTDYNIQIKNNTIYNMNIIRSGKTVSWGMAIRTLGCKTRPLTGVTIENNTISDTDRFGILLQRTPAGKVTGNSFESTSNSSIYLIKSCNYAEITNNTIARTGTIFSPAGGIGLSETTDVLISENTISSTSKDGIFLKNKSNTCTIVNNTVNSSLQNAIALYDQSNENTVEENTINDFNNNGIYTYKISSAIINKNKLYGKNSNTENGISITGDDTIKSNFTVDGNYIKTAGRYGIYIKSAPKSYIGSNTILNITKNAIYLDKGSDGSKVYYNVITYSDNSITRYNRIKVSECKKVKRYDNVIYQI